MRESPAPYFFMVSKFFMNKKKKKFRSLKEIAQFGKEFASCRGIFIRKYIHLGVYNVGETLVL